MRSRLLEHLSFANVVASLALFVALGGTGYAAFALPRDSVGARELRSRSVGHAELAPNAVQSNDVRNGALQLEDLAAGARARLTGDRGPAGPAGPSGSTGAEGDPGPPGKDAVTLWAAVNRTGTKYLGTATGATQTATGEYTVAFARSAEGCGYVATLADVDGALPSPGRIIVAADGNGGVRVRTYGLGGAAESAGFHLIVVC